MMKGFIRQSFKRQTFVAFLTVTLILVIAGGVLTVQGFQARIKADYERQDIGQEDEILRRISDMLRLSGEVIDSLAGDADFVDAIAQEGSTPGIYSVLYEYSAPVRDFATVDIYSGGKCIYTTARGGIPAALPEEYAILKEAAETDGPVYDLDPADPSAESSDLLVAQQLADRPQRTVAVVRIDNEGLESQLSGAINSRDGFMLTNRFFRPFCLIGTARDYEALRLITGNLFAGRQYDLGTDSNIYMSELEEQGLMCIYITPPALEESAVRAGYRIIMLQVFISIIICLIVAQRMSVLVAKPINKLSSAMSRFRKGDFDVRIDLEREDEFGQLATGFNKMASQLQTTMEEKVASERRLNEARISMMQAQLNPHFLYNTLDTIKWVAKANQVPEIATLSASLAGVLRSSISNDQFCTLEKETELVRNYCDIQKIRFDDSFDLTVDIGDCADAVVPKLILQPLVENSIIHGFEGRRDGHIFISAGRTVSGMEGGDLLVITVKDNGSGISNAMIAALENGREEELTGHLGLNNINTIIRLTYGNEFGVSAKRPEEGGTLMTVILPYETSHENPDGK